MNNHLIETANTSKVKCVINIMHTANDSLKQGRHYTNVSGRSPPLRDRASGLN